MTEHEELVELLREIEAQVRRCALSGKDASLAIERIDRLFDVARIQAVLKYPVPA
jgi:hypothetical protein